MNTRRIPPLALFGLLLTACGGVQPTQLFGRVNFYTPTTTLVGKFDAVQFFTTFGNSVANEQVVSAKFYVGDRSYPATRAEDNITWVYGTTKPCKDLPQGNNIKARYELADVNKTVLASKEQLLTQIDTCR